MGSVDELTAAVTPAALLMDGKRRTRELYTYLTPTSLSSTPAARRTKPNAPASELTPSLIPFVQLVALRCNTAKAIMNVIDEKTMYFLAQVSKRTLDGPQDTPMFETEDSVLMGCSSVPVSGRVCELTIRMHTDESSRCPFFVVPDMSKDPRFSKLDVVAGGPKLKFYAGTPITTRAGVNIGSLAVMDTQPRDCLTDDEERCLGETAAHIMAFLEINREAIEGRQARRMGYALNSFVSGRKSLNERIDGQSLAKRPSVGTSYGIHEPEGNELLDNSSPSHKNHGKRKRHPNGEKSDSGRSSTASSDCDTSEASKTSAKPQDEPAAEIAELDSRSHSKTFARAANLIREALELGEEGGVLFVGVTADTTVPTLLSDVKANMSDDSASASDEIQPEKLVNVKLAELTGSPTFMKHAKSIPASTLASSMEASPFLEGKELPEKEGLNLDSEVVNYFVGRYPGGKLWLLDEDAGKSSSDETEQEIASQRGTKSSRIRRRLAEMEFLRRAFPGARQLLLAPLWDPAVGRISSSCFVWSATQTRLFSTRHELSYLTAFCQTIMAECSRLDAMMADKQKSDFVGTICD